MTGRNKGPNPNVRHGYYPESLPVFQSGSTINIYIYIKTNNRHGVNRRVEIGVNEVITQK